MLQVLAHLPLVHTEPAGHALPQAPQCVRLLRVSVSQPTAAVQSAKPEVHVNPHTPPTHVEVAFGRTAHGAHDAPQEATEVLLRHAPPQA